jgi:DNA-directed RNA polymerase subunit RPC12/RpoP
MIYKGEVVGEGKLDTPIPYAVWKKLRKKERANERRTMRNEGKELEKLKEKYLSCPHCGSFNLVGNEYGYGYQLYERYGDEWEEYHSCYVCSDCCTEILDNEIDTNLPTMAQAEADEMCLLTKELHRKYNLLKDKD